MRCRPSANCGGSTRRPARPPVDLAFLRLPGFITALAGFAAGVLGGCLVGARDSGNPLMGALLALLAAVAQIVGVALVCVSKRLPVIACVVLPLFGVCGLIASLFIPERLPPVPLPPK